MAASRRRGGKAARAPKHTWAPRAGAVLAIGLGLLALALVVVLSRTDRHRQAENHILPERVLVAGSGPGTVCQSGERIPAGTGAVRISLKALSAPSAAVTVTLADRHGVLGRGTRPPASSRGLVVVPLRAPVRHEAAGRTCVTIGKSRFVFGGALSVTRVAARNGSTPLDGRLRIDYLRSGRESWWALAATIARRIGVGRGWSGAWPGLLVLLLTLGAIAAGSWNVLRSAE